VADGADHRRERAILLYDGDCALCRRGVAQLRRLDWFGVLRYENAREREKMPVTEPPLNPDRLLEEMHLVPAHGGRIYHGFGAFRWLAWRLPALWPIAPFLYLPGIPTLGQRLYLWVARNRFRLVPCHGGICTLPGTGQRDASTPRSRGTS